MNQPASEDGLRLDKWLWRARFFKSRILAGQFINSGKLRLTRNGQQDRMSKPHFTVREGDQLTFVRGGHLVDITILAMGTRRGPAAEAQTLYRNNVSHISQADKAAES